MTKAEDAVASFRNGCACAEAIVSTYGAELGLSHDAMIPSARGSGTESNPDAQVCGAITGAFTIIELKHGNGSTAGNGNGEIARHLMREFTKRFQALNGSIICRNLVGCDLSSPEALAAAQKQGMLNTRCAKFIRDAAEILEDMLKSTQPEDKALSVSASMLLDRLNKQAQAYAGDAPKVPPLVE